MNAVATHSATRMGELFAQLATKRRKALAPFFTAGFPSMNDFAGFVRLAVDNGADFVEIGMPFSDPLADGPSIQYANQVALDKGFNFSEMFKLVEKLSGSVSAPLVLMGYMNPVIAIGIDKFVQTATNSGAAGLIIPDLPPEEAGDLRAACKRYNLSLTFLAAPTSSEERIKVIGESSTDFVYAVTVAGVTGARAGFDRSIESYLRRLKKTLPKPFVAGFGISGPESARALAKHADGIVVGSALTEIIRREPKNPRKQLSEFIGSLRRALDE